MVYALEMFIIFCLVSLGFSYPLIDNPHIHAFPSSKLKSETMVSTSQAPLQ